MNPRRLKLRDKTYIMGVLNVTPDSFSDGGAFLNRDRAIGHALDMARSGADIIDVGGESTRPGAREVAAGEEHDRVIPVIKAISKRTDAFISVDTRKANIAEEAIKAGADIINDVSGLKHDLAMADVAARYDATVIVMHMKGTPETMQIKPVYENLMKEIVEGLKASIKIAVRAGIRKSDIVVDPGIGFGKTAQDNLAVLRELRRLKVLGCPICVGVSRKSFIGKTLGIKDPAGRLYGSLAASVVAVINGASILRVHNVKEAVQAARMTDAICRY
jgi:dihydropteroate synthase